MGTKLQNRFEPLRIALDYDDTFSADKPMWANIVAFMKANGCDVRFVTSRFESTNKYSNEDILQDSDRINIPIIFCNGKSKQEVVDRVNFKVNIWIDDYPLWIPSHNDMVKLLSKSSSLPETNVNLSSSTSEEKYSTETLVIPR